MVYGLVTYFLIGFGSYAINIWCVITTIGKFYAICITLILEIILVVIRSFCNKNKESNQENYKEIKNENKDIIA